MYSIPVYKVSLVKESSVKISGERFRNALDTAKMLSKYFHGVDREHFVVIALNSSNRIIGINTVSIGSLNSSIVHPRETFKAPILCNAAAIILAHNHPSGDTQPSWEDRQITTRLKSAGELLGIKVLDHIIMGEGLDYFSFTEEEGREKEKARREELLKEVERAKKRWSVGRATGKDLVLIATQHMERALTMEREGLPELEMVIKILTPVTERSRMPIRARKEAADLITAARRLSTLYSQAEAA